MQPKKVLILFASILITGCSFSGKDQEDFQNPVNQTPKTPDGQTKTIVKIDQPNLILVEGSTAQLHLVLVEKQKENVTIKLNMLAEKDLLDLPSSATIPAGTLETQLTITSKEDDLYKGDKIVPVQLETDHPSALLETPIMKIKVTENEPIPTISFEIAEKFVNENDGIGELKLHLSGPASEPISVDINVIEDTATLNTDFSLSSKQVTFQPHEVDQKITFNIVQDTLDEDDEKFDLVLKVVSGPAILGSPSTAHVTIVDDDVPTPHLSIKDEKGSESDSALVFTVSLDAVSEDDVAFDWTTSDGTATAGEDYVASHGSQVIIPAGQISTNISVPLKNDDRHEALIEDFHVTLSNVANALIDKGVATGAITDDDPLPTLQFASPSQKVSEGVGLVSVTFKLSAPSALSVSAPVSFSGSAEGNGKDYEANFSVITFAPEQTQITKVITIVDDHLIEEDETLVMTLGLPTHASLGVLTSHTITILNNDAALIINSVTSLSPDGIYKTGQELKIDVTFSDVVTVDSSGGTPYLEMNTGQNHQQARYASGSGTKDLIFSYIIQEGDQISAFDYISANALKPGGGLILDSAGNKTQLNLPTPSESGSLSSNRHIFIDTHRPDPVPEIDVPPWFSSLTQTPVIRWTAAQDPGGSGVDHYEISIGSTPGDTRILNWSPVEGALSRQQSGLPLKEGSSYFANLRAVDRAGNISSVTSSTAWVVDTIAPSAVTDLDDGTSSADPSVSPDIHWTASTDSGSGIKSYEISLGITPGGQEAQTWTSVGHMTQVTLTDLSLSPGTTYYASVRAIDEAGNKSPVTRGNGFTIKSTGFLVMTKEEYDGALGGITGARNLCLQELQSQNWKGKPAQSLRAEKVSAFLCDSEKCGSFKPSTTYLFARAGSMDLGGASVVVDGEGSPPSLTDEWTDHKYFGSNDDYFMDEDCDHWTSVTEPARRTHQQKKQEKEKLAKKEQELDKHEEQKKDSKKENEKKSETANSSKDKKNEVSKNSEKKEKQRNQRLSRKRKREHRQVASEERTCAERRRLICIVNP